MKVLFIRPAPGATQSADALEPAAFAVLRALTPDGVECVVRDELLAPLPGDEPADLAAITVSTLTARRAYQLASAFHARGVPVVLGGYHPSLCPREASGYADAVVVGDAEDTWPRVLEDLRAGRLARFYRSALPPLTASASDRRVFAGLRYPPATLVEFGRGCPGRCTFCSVHGVHGGRLRTRDPVTVAGEIREAGRRLVVFADDHFGADREATARLLDLLEPLRVRWACQAGLEAGDDPAFLARMRRAGCRCAMVGIESIDSSTRRALGKPSQAHPSRSVRARLKAFRKAGLAVYGSFVFGADGDTPAVFRRTLAFARREGLVLANFNPLLPMPGTPLYTRLRGEGRLLFDRWWLAPSFRYGRAVFRPRGMTPGQLEDGCWGLRRAFNRPGPILRRLVGACVPFASPAVVRLFLAANLVNRREVLRKQGLELAPGSRPPPWQPEADA